MPSFASTCTWSSSLVTASEFRLQNFVARGELEVEGIYERVILKGMLFQDVGLNISFREDAPWTRRRNVQEILKWICLEQFSLRLA